MPAFSEKQRFDSHLRHRLLLAQSHDPVLLCLLETCLGNELPSEGELPFLVVISLQRAVSRFATTGKLELQLGV